MRAIGYQISGPVSDRTILIDVDHPMPVLKDRDILVEVKAISVNPVDVKIRSRVQPEAGSPKILGWDGAGIVTQVGPKAHMFRPGDKVFYAGALDRPGTNAQYHAVDERLVGPMPDNLDFAEAAALPLTTITAWEALFDRLDVNKPVPGAAPAIVIIGGAGGVGSMAIQLARALTDLTIIATASREASQNWVRNMGAHHVLDHTQPLNDQIKALGLEKPPAFVFSTTHSHHYGAMAAEFMAPEGRFCLIDDPETFDIMPFKRKSISIHWEFMFARSLYTTETMINQHKLLKAVSDLIMNGTVKTTLRNRLHPINAHSLQQAHEHVANGQMIGKIVVENWPATNMLV